MMSFQVPSRFLVPIPATRVKKKKNSYAKWDNARIARTQCAIYTVDLTSYRFSQIARLPHNADNTRRRAEASIFSEMPHRGGIIDCPTIHNYKTAKVTQILCSLKAETKFWYCNTYTPVTQCLPWTILRRLINCDKWPKLRSFRSYIFTMFSSRGVQQEAAVAYFRAFS